MPAINIRPNEVISAGSNAESAKRNVVFVKNGVREINDRLDNKIKSRNDIGKRLNDLCNSLENIESRIVKIKAVADITADNYIRTENRVEARGRELLNRL